jgi:hypothetical protein
MYKRIVLTLTALSALALSACGTVKISRINADPSRYQNRDVNVEGSVTNSAGALGFGGYQIDDGTGKIYVISTGSGVPSKGSRVKVNGTVQSGATVLGKTIGTAIRERSHRVRNP